jgi:hypothetical protein
MHVVFTGSSEWMNYRYTLWLGSTDFSKTLRPFQKPRCQKSDIKRVHNLKFKHCVSKYLEYVCHLTQSCVHVKEKFLCSKLCSKVLFNICYNQGIMLVARCCISCIRARPQQTLMTQTHQLFRQHYLFRLEKILVSWVFV